MSNQDLQALFSSLRSKSNSSSALSRSHSQEPSTSYPTTSEIPTTPPPPFSFFSPSISDVAMEASKSPPAAQSLLSLLNFDSNRATSNSNDISLPWSNSTESNRPQDTPLSASGLVARLTSPSVSAVSSMQNEHIRQDNSSNQSRQPTNPLLELLNRQKHMDSAAKSPQPPVDAVKNPKENNSHTPVQVSGPFISRESTPLTPEFTKETQKPVFTYTNPFEALKASRPLTPNVATAKAITPEPVVVEKPTADFNWGSPADMGLDPEIAMRKKLTPRSRSSRQTTPQASFKEDRASVSPSRAEEHVGETEKKENITQTEKDNHIPDEPDMEQVIGENEAQASPEWEDVPGSPLESTSRIVPVYTFPIKAFLSITLQLNQPSQVGIREEGVLEISRIKKEFDQIDRSLAAATSKYICYALVKHGGIRIIRQDDGKDRHVFKHSNDRIFNVSVCTGGVNTPSSDDHAIIGTGVSGSVYYATLSSDGVDLVEQNSLESGSMIFPAFPQSDENTAGGILKTRAKRSSRHPEFFAIGRGKMINIIWPSTVMSARYGVTENDREVDVEKLFKERTLQISTGKAGKDFVFSEDDTMIVSLDKTGRLRFWDIRKLVEEENATSARMNPVIVDSPLLSLMTASPAEKSWPTSVLFVDKARPYNKGGPLRYVLVGLRQNHTLQLWDIALGKAVQEINFPHESEVDGICSVNYHPASGIIAVSHPTRNSIFFIHLSAPRYTLSSSLSQAAYVQRVAAKDPEIPKPDSTACMSGIRELAFTGRGILRSVELLAVQKPSEKSKDADENQTLFELYVVHSKGVTCLAVNKEDLGWDSESKVIQSIDAEKENLVSLQELKLGSIIEENIVEKTPSKEESQPSQNSKSAKKKQKKSKENTEEPVNGTNEIVVESEEQQLTKSMDNTQVEVNTMKEPKKSKKKSSQPVSQADTLAHTNREQSPQKQLPSNVIPTKPTSTDTKTDALSMSISGDWLNKELKKIEEAISTDFRKEFTSLFDNIQNDRATQDQTSAARQEAVLRLVSTSLNTNVEKSLSRILASQMHEIVVPSVLQSVLPQISENVARHISIVLPAELRSVVPAALHTALHDPHTSRTFGDVITEKFMGRFHQLVNETIRQSLQPLLTSIATEAAERATTAVERKHADSIRQLQLQHEADRQQISQMSKVLEGMAKTLQDLSESQFKLSTQSSHDKSVSEVAKEVNGAKSSQPEKVVANRTLSKAEIEIEEVRTLMYQRKFEEGSIKWLQSSQPVQLFDALFVNFTPEYLQTDVSPLVAFSVAVTVASSLQTHTERRLEWISTAFEAIDFNDREVVELSQHAPQLVSSMIQKLESLYMSRAESNDRDPVLQAIIPVVKKARELRTKFQEVSERRSR